MYKFVPVFALLASLAACAGGGGSEPSAITPATAAPGAAITQAASGVIAFGAPTFSTPSFNSTTENESGSCGSAIQFTGAQSDFTNEWAQVSISEQGYNGSFTVSESLQPVSQAPGNASVTSPSQVLTSTLSGASLTLSAVAAGGVNVTVTDSLGHGATCAVDVTVTTATVQSRERD